MSDSMRDNPFMQYYASIYALSMAVMLLLKAIRGVVFVKVHQWAGSGRAVGGLWAGCGRAVGGLWCAPSPDHGKAWWGTCAVGEQMK